MHAVNYFIPAEYYVSEKTTEMNIDNLQDCSSTDLYNTKKIISEILKSRPSSKRSTPSSHASSRSSSRCKNRRVSEASRKTSSPIRKSNKQRSHSLINLKSNLSFTSSSKKYMQGRSKTDISQVSDNSDSGSAEESDYYSKIIPLKSLLSSKGLCRNKHKRSHIKNTRDANSTAYIQLTSAVQRLNSTLIDVHNSNNNFSCCNSNNSRHIQKEKIDVPPSNEKDSFVKLATVINVLSEQLEKEVSHMVSAAVFEKNRLEQIKDDNSILKQRLSNSLNMQKNLEGELKALTREQKLLEEENKNLAIKIIPYLPDKYDFPKLQSKPQPLRMNFPTGDDSSRKTEVPVETYFHNLAEPLNSLNGSSRNCYEGESTFGPTVSQECYRQPSSTGFELESYPNHSNNGQKYEQILYDSQEVDIESDRMNCNNNNDDLREHMENIERIDELDSIRSYVKRKEMDIGKLQGRLNKNLEESEKLREALGLVAQEKEEIFSDLQEVVESYKEVEKERDNYASILKMILKEKNSSESNLLELLDGLLVHLNNNSTAYQSQSSKFGAGVFLESALHVIQEQNIAIREELARMKDSLQKSKEESAQLQESKEELEAKLQNMQKQLECRNNDDSDKGKDAQEKYEALDKIYKTVLAAKDNLDKCLEEKENEIVKLKDLIQASEKAASRQAKKIIELQKVNSKLQKDVNELKITIENLKQMIGQLKATLKDQRGKLCDRIKSAHHDLNQSKDHCKWLQSQIDNLNSQLVDAHERIKAHEKDKSILAQKVLSAEEERKILDRKILEIKSIMHGDTVYTTALAERNEVLQSEINRLRREKLMSESGNEPAIEHNEYSLKNSGEKEISGGDQPNTLDDLSTITSAPEKPLSPVGTNKDVSPLSRKTRHAVPSRNKHYCSDIPRAAVSLHNPGVMCYRGK